MVKCIRFFFIVLFLFTPVIQANAVEFTSERLDLTPEQIQYSEAEEADFAAKLQAIINELKKTGIKDEVLSDLTISVFPADDITVEIGGNNVKANAFFNGKIKPKIVIAMVEDKDIAPLLFHELGHKIESYLLDVKGYSWVNSGLIGWVYIDFRKYNKNISLDHNTQVQLDWHERISEWWAEDVKKRLLSTLEDDYPRHNQIFLKNGVKLEPMTEVNLLMDFVLFDT